MTVYAVSYVYDDRPEEIARVRPEHRSFLSALHEAGTLLASGPTVDEDEKGALLVVVAESASAALGLLDDDPFFQEGFITERRAKEWTQVFGPWAG